MYVLIFILTYYYITNYTNAGSRSSFLDNCKPFTQLEQSKLLFFLAASFFSDVSFFT